jgi:hypothetical protein
MVRVGVSPFRLGWRSGPEKGLDESCPPALSRVHNCVFSFFILLGLNLFVTAPLRAGVIDLYGEENVGTAGAQFMRIPVGARGVALGNAYTACAIDGAALFWNPAGILRTDGRKNFFLAHTQYAADIDLHFLSFHWRGQNFAYGISAGMLNSGEIPRTDEFHQEGTGTTFRADQYFLGLTLSRAMTDRFSLGGTVKYYQENLDEFTVRTVLLDLGILYFLGIGDLRVGFAAKNFGPDMRPGGTPPPLGGDFQPADSFQKFPAPTVGSFGAAWSIGLAEGARFLTALDFNHPSDYSESFRLGGELALLDTIFLRSGYETNRAEGGFSAGFGVAIGKERWRFRLDYAYSDMGTLGTIHNFSVDLVPLVRKVLLP